MKIITMIKNKVSTQWFDGITLYVRFYKKITFLVIIHSYTSIYGLMVAVQPFLGIKISIFNENNKWYLSNFSPYKGVM